MTAQAPHPGTLGVDWSAVGREAAEALSAYVRLDNSHPRGDVTAAVSFLTERLAADGLDWRIYDPGVAGKLNVAVRLRAERPVGKPLLLSSHMDTVQAVASDWTFDPFSGEIADGYVYGRGALDMKGTGIAELFSVLLLKRRGVELTRDVILLLTCDEEVGSGLGARWLVEQHFADFDPACVLDEGGRGLRGFFSVGDVVEIIVGEKRSIRIRLEARAEPGHGSQPWEGAATHRLVRAANAILSQDPEDRLCGPTAEMVKRLGGEGALAEIGAYRATRPVLRDTISLTMLGGGYKVNIIPERAEMTFDCRLLPDTDPASFLSNIQQVVNDPNITYTVEWPQAAPTLASWDNEHFLAMQRACEAHVPGATVTPSISVVGTDSRFFRERGVPCYGLVPFMLTGDELKGYHGIDERLSLENVELGCRIMYDLTLRIAAG